MFRTDERGVITILESIAIIPRLLPLPVKKREEGVPFCVVGVEGEEPAGAGVVGGVMALVENMPSGTAQRPGDIVKSMSGQTIEVLNTDAEGRLILADAIWYTQDRFSPKAMIDLATLTGAVVVALGHEFAGLFSNDDDLAEQIKRSAEFTGEKVWRMPLTDHFDDKINSELADMQNIGKANTGGGSITGAQFIKRFVNGTKWAHIDIAGVKDTSDDLFICSKGVTGFGVHLLYDFLCKI